MALLRAFQDLRLGIKVNVILVLVLVILLLVSVVVVANVEGVIVQIGRQRLEQEQHVIGGHFAETEQQVVSAARLMAKSPGFINAVIEGDANRARTALLVEAAPFQLSDIEVVNAQGDHLVTIAGEGIALEYEAIERWIALGMLGAEVTGFVVDQAESETAQRLLLSTVVPLKDSLGNFIGVLLIAREMNQAFMERLDFERPDVHLGLIYNERVIATDPSGEGKFDTASNSPGVQSALTGQYWISDGSEYDANNAPDLAAYIPLTLTGRTEAVISIRTDHGPLFALQDQLISTMTPLILILGAVAVLVITFFARWTVALPLAKLQQVALQMSGGDYSQRSNISRRDEIGELATAFNTMAETIQKRDADLTTANQTLERRVEERTKELRAATREAQEASRLKDEFLSIMSHELRTPLNAIIGFQGIMLLGAQLDDRGTHMMQRAQANANRLLNLINDILDVSRIESGRYQMVKTEISPNALVERLQSQMSVLAEEKKLDFNIEIDSSVPPVIFMDEDAITKIVTNLLGNAFKFTDEGSVTLVLKQQNEQLVVEVKDTGVGIPSHMHQVIFERFRQVDGSSKRAHGGSGLGLSIVQKLCTAMNGTVQVESMVGQGSTFIVSLPLEAVPDRIRS